MAVQPEGNVVEVVFTWALQSYHWYVAVVLYIRLNALATVVGAAVVPARYEPPELTSSEGEAATVGAGSLTSAVEAATAAIVAGDSTAVTVTYEP